MKQCIHLTILILILSFVSGQDSYAAFTIRNHESILASKVSRRDLIRELRQISCLGSLQKRFGMLHSYRQQGERRHAGPMGKWSFVLSLSPILLSPTLFLIAYASPILFFAAAILILLCPLAGFILGICDLSKNGASFLAIAGTILSGLQLWFILAMLIH